LKSSRQRSERGAEESLATPTPLKAIVRGYIRKAIPITWRNRHSKTQEGGNGRPLHLHHSSASNSLIVARKPAMAKGSVE
jgi:hypothetical protein